MARKNDEIENQEPENPGNENQNGDVPVSEALKKIEEWKVELETKNYVFAGAKLHNGWADGKSLTQSEYESGIKKFLAAPAGGK